MNGCGNRWVVFLILALLTLLGPGGCGYKDAPVPPRHATPMAVGDLRAELGDKGATLSWTYPRQAVSGDSLAEIDSFLLYRAEVQADGYCSTCPIPYTTWMTVPGGLLVPGEKRTATYEVSGLRPGYLYFFKVRSKAGLWIESQDSNEVSFFWQTPPATPEQVRVVGDAGKNVVQWQPVAAGAAMPPQSEATLRYQLYRSAAGGTLIKIGDPVAAPPYIDRTVESGKSYVYQVQALSIFPSGTVKSGLSGAATAPPLDRVALPAPYRVEGLRTETGVKISWDRAPKENLAGYRIYRRVVGEDKVGLVGEVSWRDNIFIDSKAPKVPLLYSISSIDTGNPASESARSAEVRVDE